MNMERILNTNINISTVSWLCSLLLLSWINIHNTVAPIKLRHFEHATFVNQLSTVMWHLPKSLGQVFLNEWMICCHMT